MIYASDNVDISEDDTSSQSQYMCQACYKNVKKCQAALKHQKKNPNSTKQFIYSMPDYNDNVTPFPTTVQAGSPGLVATAAVASPPHDGAQAPEVVTPLAADAPRDDAPDCPPAAARRDTPVAAAPREMHIVQVVVQPDFKAHCVHIVDSLYNWPFRWCTDYIDFHTKFKEQTSFLPNGSK